MVINAGEDPKSVGDILRKDWKYNGGEESCTLPFELFMKWDKGKKNYWEQNSMYGWVFTLYNAHDYAAMKEYYENLIHKPDYKRTSAEKPQSLS